MVSSSTKHGGVAITFSKPEDKIKFNLKYYCHKMILSFIVYADFEACTKTMDGCQLDPTKSYVKSLHLLSSLFGWRLKYFHEKSWTVYLAHGIDVN